jgi:RNA polymerase sigma factor (sigma-70 family)
MSPPCLGNVLDHLRTAVSLPEDAGQPDGLLLERYVSARDEVAFEALLRRHGPMVLAVCRRLLANPDDAEDAFQATFLVLVQKADSVVPREKVGSWLHGVACRAAHKARTAAARRRDRERQLRTMPDPATLAEGLWNDLEPLLDLELGRLPDKYRLPIVLCDLEGKTRAEAARQLGWPEGTVAGRLARARALLARRMSRHGLPCSAGVLAAVLAQNATSACVPGSLLLATLESAKSTATATGVVPAKVATLTEGVLATMSLTRVKIVTAVLLVLAVACVGAGVCRLALGAAEVPKKEAAPHRGEVAVAGLKKARLEAARKAYRHVWSYYQAGGYDEEVVYRWSVRLLQAQRAVAGKEADRVAASRAHLDRMKALEKMAPERPVIVDTTAPERLEHEKGRGTVRLGLMFDKNGKQLGMLAKTSVRTNVAEFTAFYRAEAELWLAEAKAKGTRP